MGGGFGPPCRSILVGVTGTGINSPLTWWRNHLSTNSRGLLARLWPWGFGICAVSVLLLVIGSLILMYSFKVNTPDSFVMNLFFTVLVLLFSIITTAAYDIQNSKRGAAI